MGDTAPIKKQETTEPKVSASSAIKDNKQDGGEKKKRRQFLESNEEVFEEDPKENASTTSNTTDKSEVRRAEPSPTTNVAPAEKKAIHPFFLSQSQQPKPILTSTPPKIGENPFKLAAGVEKPLFFLPPKEKAMKLNEMNQQKLREDVCQISLYFLTP